MGAGEWIRRWPGSAASANRRGRRESGCWRCWRPCRCRRSSRWSGGSPWRRRTGTYPSVGGNFGWSEWRSKRWGCHWSRTAGAGTSNHWVRRGPRDGRCITRRPLTRWHHLSGPFVECPATRCRWTNNARDVGDARWIDVTIRCRAGHVTRARPIVCERNGDGATGGRWWAIAVGRGDECGGGRVTPSSTGRNSAGGAKRSKRRSIYSGTRSSRRAPTGL